MSSRPVTVFFVVLLLVAVVVGHLIPHPRRPPVSKEHFLRIKEGMTPAEVEAIIGGPPGDYATCQYLPNVCGTPYDTFDSWIGDEGMIFVRFDKDTGKVLWAGYSETMRDSNKPTPFERIRQWLGY